MGSLRTLLHWLLAGVMRNSENISSDLTPFRMQAALSEYQALRAELLQKFTHQMQLYSLVVGTITIMLGYTLANRAYDLLLVVPIVSSAMAFRFSWEQAVIALLGKYLATVEEEVLPTIIGQRENNFELSDRNYWIGWEHYFEDHYLKTPSYMYAVQLVFVVIPYAPALIFSGLVIAKQFFAASVLVETSLPIFVHITAIVCLMIFGVYVSLKLRRTVSSPEWGLRRKE
jgi:hypothetical protein